MNEIEKKCPVCNKVFWVKFKNRKRIYCSNKCRLIALHKNPNQIMKKGYTPWNKLKELPSKTCLFCGKVFHAKPNQLKKRTYCSRECFYLYKKQNAKMIVKKCLTCDKEFTVSYGKRNRIYCCQECQQIVPHSEESKRKLSEKMKGRIITQFHRENISKALKGRIFSKEVRKKMSNSRKRLFQNEEFLVKYKKIMGLKPNKIEQKLDNILQNLFPNEYKYVGDFSFVLGGKNPDFMNVNGQKKLIELFGDYWHKGEDPQIRIDFFKQFGFDTLVVWEHEFTDEKSLELKLKQYCKKGVNING